MAAAAGLLLLVLLVLRQPLAELMWPQNSAQQAMSEADAALERGHLSAADGSGARELYEAALAMDPDRPGPVVTHPYRGATVAGCAGGAGLARAGSTRVVDRGSWWVGAATGPRQRGDHTRVVGDPESEEAMTTHRIGYFVGSLSSTSINRTLSKALIALAPDELELLVGTVAGLLCSAEPEELLEPEAEPPGRVRR